MPLIQSIVANIQQLDALELQELVRQLGWPNPPDLEWPPDDWEGGGGVREPRRPIRPRPSGTAAVEYVPPTDINAAAQILEEELREGL